MRLLLSNRQYDDTFPQFTGIMMVGLGIVVLTVIKYGNPIFYRMTLIVRLVLFAGILGLYLKTRDPLFLVVLCVLGLGVLITGSIYLSERRAS